MFRVHGGQSGRYCDGISRRTFVQLGAAGLATASLSQVLRAREVSASREGAAAKDTSVIFLYLDGGPGHMDLYDMKPDAPAEYRGIWRPITTNVPGVEISELFPRQAQIADKFAIIRSLYHGSADHYEGSNLIMTARRDANAASLEGKSPSIGAIASKVCGPRKSGMPSFVAVPYASTIGLQPGYFGAQYLGLEHNPFQTGGDPNAADFKVQNIQLTDGLTIDRLENRRALLNTFDKMRREVDASGNLEAMDRFQRKAYELVTGPAAREAFDLSKEDPKLRDEYGRHTWGQSTLLARRLVEAGCTYVTVALPGWDHHWGLEAGMNGYLPIVDALVSTLFKDLEQRGILDKTLVMMCGEFSRTPRMNDGGNGGAPMSMGTPGRDHWGNAMFCLMGGGGVKGGRIVGATNRLGESVLDRPVSVGDLHATIYRVLGIDPSVHFLNGAGRPVAALDEGKPVHELF